MANATTRNCRETVHSSHFQLSYVFETIFKSMLFNSWNSVTCCRLSFLYFCLKPKASVRTRHLPVPTTLYRLQMVSKDHNSNFHKFLLVLLSKPHTDSKWSRTQPPELTAHSLTTRPSNIRFPWSSQDSRLVNDSFHSRSSLDALRAKLSHNLNFTGVADGSTSS